MPKDESIRNEGIEELQERVERHRDGSVRAQGQMLAGELHGYWEWFRKDGSRMRSGFFDQGRQTGDWTTYAGDGSVVKVTRFKIQEPGSGAAT